MIKRVTPEEFIGIYKKHLRHDFVRGERRPLGNIQKLFRREVYSCWALYEEEKLQAYACFIQLPGMECVLLDYFAVVSGKRGGGIGSRFLSQLRGRMDTDGIIIECEMPEKAMSEEDRKVRQKRIAFYQKGGALLTGETWRVGMVDYNLLWLPVGTSETHGIGRKTREIYRKTFPRLLIDLATRLGKVKSRSEGGPRGPAAGFDRLYAAAMEVVGERTLSPQTTAGSVAAALLTRSGNIYTGVCIDTQCSMGFCAEHAAAAAMVTRGEHEVVRMIAVDQKGKIMPPCGRCREFICQLHERNCRAEVKVDDKTVMLLGALLPYGPGM